MGFDESRARRDAYTSSSSSGYALSGQIMLVAIIVLFFVVLLLFAFHIYARWYLVRARRRYLRNRRSHRANIIFHVDDSYSTPAANRGLDARALNSLPVFTFSSKTHPDSIPECAVCLSEFEENESGRTLPSCNHSFHIDCIDMWFLSHSTCPLCRTPVEGRQPERSGDAFLRISDPEVYGPEPAAEPESCSVCESQERAGTSSSDDPRKLSIDVPMRRGQGFEGDSDGLDSGTSQSFKSPMTRMLSFRRMLSRERRQTPCPSPRNAANWGLDLELGVEENRLTQ